MKLQIHACALLLTTLGMTGTSFGAGAPAVPESLRNCATKQDVLQRLSCFDAELAKLESTQAAAPAPAPAAPSAAPAPRPAAATPPQPQATMGAEQLRNAPGVPLGEEQLRKPAKPSSSSSLGSSLMFWRSSDKAKEKEKEADTGMTARIDSIRKTALGLYVITLDNGQVWQQQEFEADFPLEAGETIRIDKGAMGSYRLRPVREGWKRWFRINRTK